MNLKYFAIIFSILTVAEIGLLAFSSADGAPITEMTISNIGSLDENYLFYLVATSILIIMFTIFLHSLYKTMNGQPKKYLYLIPVLSISGLLFKAGREVITAGRIIHITLFIASAILTLKVVSDLNEIKHKIRKTKKPLFTAPRIALFGTVIFAIFIGMNVITEFIYVGTLLSWMNLTVATIGNSI